MDTAIALIGDVMLGRLVDELVVGNASVRPRDPWGEVLPLLATADLRFINLECVISARGHEWRPESKAFHFRARPRAVEFLKAAKVDCVTLANNHVLDYGPEALLDCLDLLDQAGIKRAGAGRDVNEASEPAIVDGPGGPVAVVALTDNEPEWEAGAAIPGTHYVSIDSHGLKEPYRSRLGKVMRLAKNQAALVVVGAHAGPNWGAPSRELRAMAKDILDLGADVYWGHSNHTPQGIEILNGKPILYSTGDFLDDYAVDEHERNDLSFLFILELQGRRITGLRLHPVTIDDCRVRLARDRDADFLRRTMVARCVAFGTPLEFDGHVGHIVLA